MAARTITDDLLKTAVGLRIYAGVSTSKIESLVGTFTSGQLLAGDGLPRAGVQEIPLSRREEFLEALAGLPPEPDYSPADAARVMTASDVWPLRIAEDAMMHRTGPEIVNNRDGAPEPTDCAPPPAPAGEISQEAADEKLKPEPIETVDCIILSDAAAPADPVPFSQKEVVEELKLANTVDCTLVKNAESPAINSEADSKKGVTAMWNKDELERMKREIGSRRDEMVDRHAKELREVIGEQAEELRRLDADRKEIEALEQAIDAISRKIKPPSPDAGIASLEDERGLRQQGLS